MILEIAMLHIKSGKPAEFEITFKKAQSIIASMPGYLGHELKKCVENDHHYALLVRWNKLEDHTTGFRQSPQYQEWKTLLHHYYEPTPIVLHYQ